MMMPAVLFPQSVEHTKGAIGPELLSDCHHHRIGTQALESCDHCSSHSISRALIWLHGNDPITKLSPKGRIICVLYQQSIFSEFPQACVNVDGNQLFS